MDYTFGTSGCWDKCGEKGGLCESVCGDNGYCCSSGKTDLNGDCPTEGVNFMPLDDEHKCITIKSMFSFHNILPNALNMLLTYKLYYP